jgi:hypothetical protein
MDNPTKIKLRNAMELFTDEVVCAVQDGQFKRSDIKWYVQTLETDLNDIINNEA